MSTQHAAFPILSGIIPPLANPYLARTETGFGLMDGPRPGETIVLADSAAALATQAGGTGKTQLAASFAHSMRNARAVDVLVWVPAASREAILASFAQAAGRLTDAVAVLRRALADCERYLGPDHPMTSTVRENLQAAAD